VSLLTRGGADSTVRISVTTLSKKAALAIQQAEERNPSPENRAALAVLDLVGGDPEKAIPLLREAHARKPADPRFLNDLSAALLVLGKATGNPWQTVEAVEMAAQAERLDPSPPALFNLALALEQLGVRRRAIAAWERYLEQDSGSPWAEEAAQRRDRLEQEASKAQELQLLTKPAADLKGFPGNPWADRQLGERVLLTRWAEQTLAGRMTDAEAALAQAEALALTLTTDAGRLLAASAAAIREAEQSGDRERLDLLVHGHQAFGQAFLRLREERTVEARALIAVAIRDLQAARTPFELRAQVLQAWMVAEPDWDELRRIGEVAEAGGFSAIAAEERRIAAYRISLEGRLEPAADIYRDAGQRFEALGEREAASVVSVMLSELLADLGEERESSSELATALTAGPWMADPSDRYSIYVVAASAVSSRFSRAAVELRLEAADACGGLPERPLCAVDSWLRVASLTPDTDVAEDALQQAQDLLRKSPASDGKARTEIDLMIARARRLGSSDHTDSDREQAADLYGEAAARYDALKLAVSAADTRASRARLLQGLGRSKEAVAEYRAGLRTFRLWDQSDRFRPERAEKRSPAVLRDTYEGLIGAELDLAGNGVSPAAFLLSEEMRDRLAPRRSVEIRLPTLDDIPRFIAAVPRGTAVVEYAIFGNRSAAWILAGGRIDQVKLTFSDKLGEQIGLLVSERNIEGWKHKSETLFKDLIAPVLARLPAGTEQLILVPDSQLYGLPFRALWNSGTSHYLDEDFTISLAPSVRQLLGSGEDRRLGPLESRLEVLSLGFQKFIPDLHLAELSQAGNEAASVLGVYGSQSNPCSASDWVGFRRCVPQADVIHLATHATANSDTDQSWLAFPGEIVSIERLWRELPDLLRHPMVVLSACESVATASGGEGLGGLARPFLASGARAVVGTLWKLDDKDGKNLFPMLHRTYQVTRDAPRALRETREELAKWADTPWVWGGVEAIRVEL
jgi:tetratricopeptide (TPR) repeat protein